MRGVCLLLLMPLVGAQIVPMYDQLPDPNEYGSCDLEVQSFAQLPVGLENLHFHNGTMYVTAFGDGLWQVQPNGSFSQIVADAARPGATPVDAHHNMMGVTSFGDHLFVSQGQSLATPVDGRILRFVPGQAEYEVFADGFDGVNGMAADGDGNLYVAHGFREGVYKVTPDGAWSLWKELPSANGVSIHPDGEHLVLAAAFDAGARVIAVPFSNPDTDIELFTFNALSPLGPTVDVGNAVVPKLLDDITVAGDRVIGTSHERLQTLLGDPETGETCVLATHGNSPTSVRIASDFDGWHGYAFITDNDGLIQVVQLEETSADAVEAMEENAEAKSTNGLGLIVVLMALFVLRKR